MYHTHRSVYDRSLEKTREQVFTNRLPSPYTPGSSVS